MYDCRVKVCVVGRDFLGVKGLLWCPGWGDPASGREFCVGGIFFL